MSTFISCFSLDLNSAVKFKQGYYSILFRKFSFFSFILYVSIFVSHALRPCFSVCPRWKKQKEKKYLESDKISCTSVLSPGGLLHSCKIWNHFFLSLSFSAENFSKPTLCWKYRLWIFLLQYIVFPSYAANEINNS